MNHLDTQSGVSDRHGVAFGVLLRRHRRAAGLSQEALAERSALSRRGIADLERGARNFPHGETIRRLAEALDLTTVERSTLLRAGQRPAQSDSPRHTLQVEPSALIGRHRELSELQLLITSTRVLTLTGPGGIGKTRLAQELGRRLKDSYADGSTFVELAPVTDATLVPHALALALGVRAARHTTVLDAIRAHVGAHRLLIVLDNCEHLLDAVASVADALVRHCPHVQILATSREAMRIRGEVVWPIPPLRMNEANELFLERARAAQATLHFTDDDMGIIADLCRRLDGLPLAIELAAARTPALGLAQLQARLSEHLHVLSSGNRLAAPRHQTMRAAIDWSFALLVRQEQLLFERLSVFAGGWSLESAESVCGLDAPESRDVLELLAGLVAKSLVVAEASAGVMRYRYMETVRQYAVERLEASGESTAAQLRHASYFRSLAEAGAVTRIGVRYSKRMDLLRREDDNLRAALSWMLAGNHVDEGLALCRALGGYWLSQGFLVEAEEWLGRFLERADQVDWATVADCLHVAGRIAEYRGAYELAQRQHRQSLSIARQYADATRAARALCGIADAEFHQGAYARAQGDLHEALAFARESGSLPELAQALLSLGRVADQQGDGARARLYRDECLQTQRRLGDEWGVAYVLNELGQQARRDGQQERAQVLLEESLVLWRRSGSRMGERSALMNLAAVTFERKLVVRSATLVRESLVVCRDIADASATTSRCLEIAAQVINAFAPAETAVALIAAAAAQRQALGAPVPPQERRDIELTVDASRASLEGPAFQLAWQRGEHLTPVEALELAAASLAPFLELPAS